MASITLRANVVTDSSGAATVYVSDTGQSPYPLAPIAGLWRVHTISYIKNDFASGVDFTITEYETGQSVWTEVNVDASETNTDGVTIADSQIKIVIANGGSSKTGAFIFHLTDQLPDITTVTGSGGLSDGDYGDVTVSGTGTVISLDAGVVAAAELASNAVETAKILDANVTYAKIQNVSATDKVLGRSTAGAGVIEEIACTAAGRAILDDADAAAQRTTLGLVIGTNVQAYDAELAALAGLTSAADKGIQFTGSGTAGTYDLTAAGKALLDDADAAAQRTTLGAAAASHTHVQADLTGLTTADSPQFTAINVGHASDTTLARVSAGVLSVEGNTIYAAGGTDVPVADGGTGASTAAGAATNLGLGTGDSPQFTAVNIGHASDTTLARSGAGDLTIEGNAIYRAGGTDVPVTDGGTGASTAAAALTNLGALPAALTPDPSVDHTFSGPSVTLTAGEALAFPEVVYVKSDGKMGKADADAAATAPVFAMASATISSDAAGVFILPGSFVRDDTWTWTVGGLIYLSTTAGALTQTAPSGTDDVVQVVGIATHADRMWFKPEMTFITVV